MMGLMAWEFIKTDTMPAGGVTHLPSRVLPFIWYFVSQVKWQIFTIAGCFAVSSLMFSMMPYGIAQVVDSFTGGFDPEKLLHAAWIFVGIFIIRAISECTGDFLASCSMSPFTGMIRRQIATYVNGHSYRYFQDDFAGRIATKVTGTPTAIQGLVSTISDQFVYITTLVIGTAFLFASVGPIYLVVMMGWLALYALILWTMIPRIRAKTQGAAKQRNIMVGRYVDVIVNILQVKLFARMDYEDKVMRDLTAENSDLWIRRDLTDMAMNVMIYVSIMLFFAGILGALYFEAGAGRVTPGQASMILGGMIFLFNSSVWVSKMISGIFQTYGEIYEGIDLITQAHEVVDMPAAQPIQVIKGDIQIKDLTFSYPGRAVFSNLNIHIPAGQRVGLVGPSGAGKSTLIQLLMRLYDVQDGGIYIDGQNIAEVRQDGLREQLAVIPQSSDLMHRSIRDNIAYGRLDATDVQVEAAARQAHAHDFILELQDKEGRRGYHAHVGERGVKLSGGQRQRVAIARAMLKDARILLLDEATSALDSESEALVQQALFTLMQGRTAIVIAHRLSTIMAMDRLLVLRDGQIIEDGSHQELLAKNGYYAQLWARQAGGFLKI